MIVIPSNSSVDEKESFCNKTVDGKKQAKMVLKWTEDTANYTMYFVFESVSSSAMCQH